MDDLKTFGRDNQQQERLLQTVKRFSDDINMKFGLDKCATAEFKRGKLTKRHQSFLTKKQPSKSCNRRIAINTLESMKLKEFNMLRRSGEIRTFLELDSSKDQTNRTYSTTGKLSIRFINSLMRLPMGSEIFEVMMFSFNIIVKLLHVS